MAIIHLCQVRVNTLKVEQKLTSTEPVANGQMGSTAAAASRRVVHLALCSYVCGQKAPLYGHHEASEQGNVQEATLVEMV